MTAIDALNRRFAPVSQVWSARMILLCAAMLSAPFWFAWLNNPKTDHKACGCEREGHACMCAMK